MGSVEPPFPMVGAGSPHLHYGYPRVSTAHGAEVFSPQQACCSSTTTAIERSEYNWNSVAVATFCIFCFIEVSLPEANLSEAQNANQASENLNLAVGGSTAGVRLGGVVFVAVVFSAAECAVKWHTNSPMTAIGVVVVVTAVTVVTVTGPTFIIP